MTSFVRSQFRFRASRTAALGLGIVVAAVSFTLLTAAATTSSLSVQGTVQSNYRAAYDVLVRPRGAAQRLEQSEGLVRPNFLSGVFGGITMQNYTDILGIPNVEVAAPIANVGYVLPGASFGVSITGLLNQDRVQLFRVRSRWTSQTGLSTYPAPSNAYVYYTRRHPLNSNLEEVVNDTTSFDVCAGIYETRSTIDGPFEPRPSISCYSARSPDVRAIPQLSKLLPVGQVGTGLSANFPVFLAAIDPEQEARLLRLDRAIVDGRFLKRSDKPTIVSFGGVRDRTIPVILSTRTYVDEQLQLDIERLDVPAGVNVPARLGSPGSRAFLEGLAGTTIDRRSKDISVLYKALTREGILGSNAYWTVSATPYRSGRPPLEPRTVSNGISVWESPAFSGRGGGLGYAPAPASNADVQFRELVSHPTDNRCFNDICPGGMRVVGRFDPARLPGFSKLSQVPLETYYPPTLEGANSKSRGALKGKRLLPSQNLGDYIQQPPLILTTLEGMKPFFNPKQYPRTAGKAAAPISAIRVRVAGVTGPDELSQARVRAVATAIYEKTGLEVDITAGSSPKPILVNLPKGKFGRPELLLREGWSKKGVSISFLRALDRKSLALFGLVLLICGFFLGNGALASVRSRRREIGTLRTIGWSQGAIFAVVLAELALVGLVAGVVGTAVALGIVSIAELELPLRQTFLVVPISIGLAVAAGALPAWAAAKGDPLDAVRPAVVGRMRKRHIRRFLPLAVSNLLRTPGRTLVGAAGLAIGVAALTVLLAIERAFQGVLVDTLLGSAISIQVRGPDLVAVILTIVLAGLSVADVLFLNLRDRAAEIATLRTVGWGDSHLASVVVLEGIGLGVLGGGVGAAIGLGVGAAFGVPLGSLVPAALLAAGGGVVVAALASLLPLAALRGAAPPTVLAEE
ncbi:MAG: ABC transporter permease [Gaiellaceae bacterium]